MAPFLEKVGTKGTGYWTGCEEPEVTGHSRIFASCGFFLNDCFSANYPFPFLHWALFTPQCQSSSVELVLQPPDSGTGHLDIHSNTQHTEDEKLKSLTRLFYTYDDTIHTGGWLYGANARLA